MIVASDVGVYKVCWCVCIELYSSHATKAPPISTPTASMEVRYLHLHPPLRASKAVLSSWSLVVACALFTRGKVKA